jgi:ABC-2 type transport system ATP-binding protein
MQQDAYKKVAFTVKEKGVLKGFKVDGAMNMELNGEKASFIFKGDSNLLLSEQDKFSLVDIEITEPSLEENIKHYYSWAAVMHFGR